MEIMQVRQDKSRSFKQKVVDIPHYNFDKSEVEIKRIVTKQGTVIRYMKNKGIQIMFANGNYSVYSPKYNTWTKTKNSGERKQYKMSAQTGKTLSVQEIEPLRVDHKIDPETNVDVTVRSDKVTQIFYKDSTLTMHHDNTLILSKNDGSEKIIEKKGFAPIKIKFSAFKSRAKTVIGLGGQNALMGFDDIMERSNDGYLFETYLPDQTLVQTYREKQQLEGYNNYSCNTIHLFNRHDFSVLKVKQDGEIVVITSNQRSRLNDIGYHSDLGRDKDYFFELFGVESDRRSGVYTANVIKGTIQTKDDEGNVFVVYANGESIERLAVSFNLDQTAETLARKRPDSPRNLPDGEYIEEECKFLVPPQTVMEPRLIFIKNDESGYEFLNEKQLDYFFRVRSVDNESMLEAEDITIGTENAVLITSVKDMNCQKNKSLIFPATKIPQCVGPEVQTVYIPPEPIKKLYTTDQIIEFKEFDQGDVDKFDDDMGRYNNHKQMQVDEKARLTVIETEADLKSKSAHANKNAANIRSKQEVFEEMKFFYTIIKMQGKKKKQMNEAELKIWSRRAEFTDTEDNDEDLYSTDEDEIDANEQVILDEI